MDSVSSLSSGITNVLKKVLGLTIYIFTYDFLVEHLAVFNLKTTALQYVVGFFAIDFNTTLPKLKTFITAEWAWIKVNVPTTFSQQYGNKQQGGFLDLVQPVIKKKMLGWQNATLNIACRLEYVDWNKGTFTSTGGNIAEDLWSIMPAISFRPSAQTVLRFNYRYQSKRDLLGNPPAKTGGFSFGISTYF